MKTIKIKLVDFHRNFNFEKSLTYKILSKHYNVVISDKPDYIFYSGLYGGEHTKYKDCVKIFYTMENLAPDFNLCDYAIGFEYLNYEDRYCRMPYYLFKENDIDLCLHKHQNNSSILKQKNGFCSFVYSNGSADPIRDMIFNELTKYKKVDSGGKWRNNINIPNGVNDKNDFQKHYKFAIACENSKHSGYSTEKIVQAFASKCIPIYWGDTRIKEIFNENHL